MKIFLPTLLFLVLFIACTGNVTIQSDEIDDAVSESEFDEELANELGADDYGMKTYVMAFLKRGPNRPKDSTISANLQRAHLDNIKKLAEEGKLVMAGPMISDGDLRGIYVFDVETIEEAKALTETDPAIQYGSLEMELHPWYASAALVKLSDIHGRIARLNP